jgi:hypothetical protein
MITQQVFKRGMALILDYFKKELGDDVLAIWQEYLNESLENEEFLYACKHAILHSRYWPTAGELVGFAKGNEDAEVLREWTNVLRAAENSSDESQLQGFCDRTRYATQQIGGLRVVGFANEFELKSLEKKFGLFYKQTPDKQLKALPQSKDYPSLDSAIVQDARRRTEIRKPAIAPKMPKFTSEELRALEESLKGGNSND